MKARTDQFVNLLLLCLFASCFHSSLFHRFRCLQNNAIVQFFFVFGSCICASGFSSFLLHYIFIVLHTFVWVFIAANWLIWISDSNWEYWRRLRSLYESLINVVNGVYDHCYSSFSFHVCKIIAREEQQNKKKTTNSKQNL